MTATVRPFVINLRTPLSVTLALLRSSYPRLRDPSQNTAVSEAPPSRASVISQSESYRPR